MSGLHKVLRDYSVPLQIWLAPDARAKVAEAIIPSMQQNAKIETHPLPQIETLQGPAVLVVSAREICGLEREDLRRLAQKAHPGRAVLVGGTSDRDILMDAINNWGVIRVVPTDADPQTIVDAIQAAGAYLNREVAMETAIDDLDIETTMLDSAIDQIHGNRDQDRHIDRGNVATTFAAGLMDLVEREREWIESLEDMGNNTIENAKTDIEILTQILESAHDFAIEESAGIPITPSSVDHLVDQIRTLLSSHTGGHSGSGTQVSINPYVLFQGVMSLGRHDVLGSPNSIDAHRSGEQTLITLSFDRPVASDFLAQWTQAEPMLWGALQHVGVLIRANNNANECAIIELILPIQERHHG